MSNISQQTLFDKFRIAFGSRERSQHPDSIHFTINFLKVELTK